ncbi:Fic family protein [uncultured Sphingomonas sp.]|uniref:Fic family protein n=1 Tax=uncultured Sphingomonas sp. TaxID=158754 RepID=UPI0035CAB53E
MKRLYAAGLPPVTEAVAVYAHTVFAHPFRDGNGRLARALIYGPLRRGGLVSSPCLGLGPTFDLCRRPLAFATLALSERADWPRYVADAGEDPEPVRRAC